MRDYLLAIMALATCIGFLSGYIYKGHIEYYIDGETYVMPLPGIAQVSK